MLALRVVPVVVILVPKSAMRLTNLSLGGGALTAVAAKRASTAPAKKWAWLFMAKF